MFLLVGGTRVSYRYFRWLKMSRCRNCSKVIRVMIIGAGSAGSMIIKELKNHTDMHSIPILVVDDDKCKRNTRINGVPVKIGRDNIRELAKKYEIDEIIVAIPSASKNDMMEILKICKETGCKLRTLPT